jgi:hypothetical protein
MHRLVRQGELYMNGISVGTVSSEGMTNSWFYVEEFHSIQGRLR